MNLTSERVKFEQVSVGTNRGDAPSTGVIGQLSDTTVFDAGVGKMPSWSGLAQAHVDSVYGLAYQLAGNQQDTEDLTQETFMHVSRPLKSYRPGIFKGWLHRITTNLLLDMVRHRQVIRVEALPENYGRVPGTLRTPEQAVDDAMLDPNLGIALAELQPGYRAVVVPCDVVGLTYEGITSTLGLKIGIVRSRIHRARSSLRVTLEHLEKERQELSGSVTIGQISRIQLARTAVVGLIRQAWLLEILQSVIQQGDDKCLLSTEHLGAEAIVAFINGELSVVIERRTQTYLMACPGCRREVAKQQQTAKRLRDSTPLHIPTELCAYIADFAGSCGDSKPHRSAWYLARRPPESLSAALEQIVRGFHRDGSHQWANIALSMIPRLPRTSTVSPQLVGYSVLQGKSLATTPVPPFKSIRRGKVRRHAQRRGVQPVGPK